MLGGIFLPEGNSCNDADADTDDNMDEDMDDDMNSIVDVDINIVRKRKAVEEEDDYQRRGGTGSRGRKGDGKGGTTSGVKERGLSKSKTGRSVQI
jgi:hypothetical protein